MILEIQDVLKSQEGFSTVRVIIDVDPY